MTKKSGVPETLLVAAASALSYGVAFAYQTGYASFYGIPPLLISPSIGTVLKAAGAVGLAILSGWYLFIGIWPFVPRSDTALARAIRRQLIIGFIIGLIAFQMFDGWRAWLALLVALGFYGFFEFVFPLLVHGAVAGYENKLLAQEEIEAASHSHSISGRAQQMFGENPIRMIFVAWLLLSLGWLVGQKTAKNQEDFFVITDRPSQVVIAMEENIAILADYDAKTMSLTGSYSVERLSDSRIWSFQKRHIGKLAIPDNGIPTATSQKSIEVSAIPLHFLSSIECGRTKQYSGPLKEN